MSIQAQARAADPVVTTTSGRVRGLQTAAARVFRAVPYAAPPTGALRFAAPRPHPGWSGIRDATRPGPTAPQPPRGRLGRLDVSPFFGDGWVSGDDYLTVDVWSPRDPAPRAPVIVFVHCGAAIAGSTRGPVHDGSAFARDGVVLVTVNHRLGIPGFLHLPDAPDNRGRLDVIAALRWVKDNIDGFGGDPGNVTLAGQSAGAMTVAGIVGAPDARGAHRRAIIQSGSGTAAFTREQAGIVSAAVGRSLGVEPTAAGLAACSDRQLVDVLAPLMELDLTTDDAPAPIGGITPFGLVLDRQPADTLAERGTGVDLLIGSNSEESSLYLTPFRDLADATEADLHLTAARFHPDPAGLVAAYRAARPSASLAALQVALLGDGMFGVGTRRYAEAHARSGDGRTFVYEFTWRSDALDGQLGASHLMELPFAFDNADLAALHGPDALLGTRPPPADLASRMHGAWVRFATDGDPGWSPYSPARPAVEVIGETWESVIGRHAAEFNAW
ncbi:carboxylesterase/lipase family protein [Pseudonocardia sp. GCM10023141]|uniref:carboxylesterase/lipase family protein n=1 Tax=Pseudonocardia sp. GCM10023141 TaxID=3252653 RepID=UPI003606D308